MEAKEKAIDNAAKNAFVLDESVDLRRKKIGIQMMKLRLIYSSSENPTKSDWSGWGLWTKSIQILEADIAELEDISPSCHSEAANPVNVEENVDEDNSNCETESGPTSSVTSEKSGSKRN